MAKDNERSGINDSIVVRLTDIVGKADVLSGEDRENYARDESPRAQRFLPDLVVRPGDAAQVSEVLKLANQERIPVTVRGGGTGLSGGAVAVNGGIVLSMERMNRIIEVDRENFVATVEPAVTLADLFLAVEEHGLCYPLFPGEKMAAIGGNVATNAGGMKAVKYGVTRHFVLGLEAVLATGEIIKTGGKYVKSSTGYDLTQLLVGSEGTLAVITRVLLRLTSPPGTSEILFIPFNSLHDAISAVPDILSRGIVPVGIEFMQRDILKLAERFTGNEIPHSDHDSFLVVFVEATDDEEFQRTSRQIGDVCLARGAVDVYVPSSERAKRNLIESRQKFYPAMQQAGILEIADVVVPRSRIATFVERTHQLGVEHDVPLIALGHAGDGNVHLCLMDDGTAAAGERATNLMPYIYEVGTELGGTISGEHGIGIAKKGFLPIATDDVALNLMRRVKLAFDPNNILNPGKIIDAA